METVAFATVATRAIVAIIWKPKKRSRRPILFATAATGAIIWKPGFSNQCGDGDEERIEQKVCTIFARGNAAGLPPGHNRARNAT